MGKNVISNGKNLIHVSVNCDECNERITSYYLNDYIGAAKKHVRQTGHSVTVETAYTATYSLDGDKK